MPKDFDKIFDFLDVSKFEIYIIDTHHKVLLNHRVYTYSACEFVNKSCGALGMEWMGGVHGRYVLKYTTGTDIQVQSDNGSDKLFV